MLRPSNRRGMESGLSKKRSRGVGVWRARGKRGDAAGETVGTR